MNGPGSDGLILPPGTERTQQLPPTPICVDCKKVLEVGDTISSVVADVGPGMLQMAPVHLACVLRVDEKEENGDEVQPEGS